MTWGLAGSWLHPWPSATLLGYIFTDMTQQTNPYTICSAPSMWLKHVRLGTNSLTGTVIIGVGGTWLWKVTLFDKEIEGSGVNLWTFYNTTTVSASGAASAICSRFLRGQTHACLQKTHFDGHPIGSVDLSERLAWTCLLILGMSQQFTRKTGRKRLRII